MPERQTYFRDMGDDDTKGVVVIETDGDHIRVTENRDGDWCKPFWIPVNQFDSLPLEEQATLSSDQFMRVCDACGVMA